MGRKKNPLFWKSLEFKSLKILWYLKLKQSGFKDIEQADGALYDKNNRTQGYRQQDDLRRISSALCAYVENPDIKLTPTERLILELKSQGEYRKVIIEKTGKSHQTVWKCCKKHIPIALGLYAQEEEESGEE